MPNLKEISDLIADKEKMIPTNSASLVDSEDKEQAVSRIEEAMDLLKKDGVSDPLEWIEQYVMGEDHDMPLPDEKPKGRIVIKQVLIEKLKKKKGK